MNRDFHQSHWREIEADRLARYEEMLVYRPQHDAMIAPLGIEAGHTVVEFLTEHTDPVNAAILAVSEDLVTGFQRQPFHVIAAQSGVVRPRSHR